MFFLRNFSAFLVQFRRFSSFFLFCWICLDFIVDMRAVVGYYLGVMTTTNETILKGKTMTRTDNHSPANYDPIEYTYHSCQPELPEMDHELAMALVACGPAAVDSFNRERDEMVSQRRAWMKMIDANGIGGNFNNNGNCDHCGAWFTYGIAYTHNPTGKMIVIGETCASNRFDGEWAADLKTRKQQLKSLRQKSKSAVLGAAFLSHHDGLGDALKFDHHIVSDIASKLRRDGSISDAQIELVYKIIRENEQRETEKQSEPTPTTPVVIGRVEMFGWVLGTRCDENGFGGSTIKMLVRLDDANKIWVTAPDAILGNAALRGCRVRFTATVTRSDTDEHFGFGKRPSKSEILAVPVGANG